MFHYATENISDLELSKAGHHFAKKVFKITTSVVPIAIFAQAFSNQPSQANYWGKEC